MSDSQKGVEERQPVCKWMQTSPGYGVRRPASGQGPRWRQRGFPAKFTDDRTVEDVSAKVGPKATVMTPDEKKKTWQRKFILHTRNFVCKIYTQHDLFGLLES